MAQPTRSDDQVVRRRLSHNNLRRKKWRRRQPRAERKRPRRSGNFSALTFGVLVEHPIFFVPVFFHRRKLLLARRAPRARVSPRSEVAIRRADVPGGRVRWRTGRPRNPSMKGGILYGEEGEGRKEKGGEEEITPPLGEKGDALRPLFLCTGSGCSRTPPNLSQRGSVPDLNAADHIPRLNTIDDLDAVHHAAKRGVARVQVRLR